MAQQVITAGIDAGKLTLEIFIRPLGLRLEVPRDPAALDAVAQQLIEHQVAVVAIEASGGYERLVIERLTLAGLQVVRLNPLHVRRFAQAGGRRAKNDRIDAEVIAHYAATFPEEGGTLRDPDRDALAEHLLVRAQTLDMATACANQLQHLRDRKLAAALRRRLASLKQSLLALDRRIAGLIAAQPRHRALAMQLRSAAGVGPVVAATLIALLPELGSLTRRQIASLVGLAPYDDDSGRRQGRRAIAGGRKHVRKALYMAALVAIRRSPTIAAFAKRLHGKKPKVIIVACMRKLLVILNAMVRDQTTWRQA
jgi:transposase